MTVFEGMIFYLAFGKEQVHKHDKSNVTSDSKIYIGEPSLSQTEGKELKTQNSTDDSSQDG